MPEGDTIVRTARTLHRALSGQTVTRFESVYPALTRIDHDRPLAGRTVVSVTSRGKHLLMSFSGDLVLHTHMRMHGSWHIYRPGERWQRPSRDMRIVLATAAYEAVGFNVPVAELLTARQLATHPALQALGPDLADPAFDTHEAQRRIRRFPDETMHELLLNQRVVAGIGNVLKSEILFVSGIDPFVRVKELSDDRIAALLDQAVRVMAMNAGTADQMSRTTNGRATTGRLNPDEKLWVYGRGGQPCRRCGTLIRSKAAGIDARLTYWCPACQTT